MVGVPVMFMVMRGGHISQGLPQATPTVEQHSIFKMLDLIWSSHLPSLTLAQQVPNLESK